MFSALMDEIFLMMRPGSLLYLGKKEQEVV